MGSTFSLLTVWAVPSAFRELCCQWVAVYKNGIQTVCVVLLLVCYSAMEKSEVIRSKELK